MYQVEILRYMLYFAHLTNGESASLAVKFPNKAWGKHTQKKDVFISYT